MNTEKYSKEIEKLTNTFLDNNLKSINTHLENNKINLRNEFSKINIKSVNAKSWGIYVFYIQSRIVIETYEQLNNLWETNSKGEKLKSPKVIKSRFQSLLPKKDNCLYIGKSENIKKRIEQHIHQKTAPSTYGLKISEHNRLHLNTIFKFSYFILKENPKENIGALKHLLISLEKKLRTELRPLVGKQ